MDVPLVNVPGVMSAESLVTKPARVGLGISVNVDVHRQMVLGTKAFATVRANEWLLIIWGVDIYHVIPVTKK